MIIIRNWLEASKAQKKQNQRIWETKKRVLLVMENPETYFVAQVRDEANIIIIIIIIGIVNVILYMEATTNRTHDTAWSVFCFLQAEPVLPCLVCSDRNKTKNI